MIFAGDEIGAQGAWGEDSRSPFPWNGESERDEEIRRVYQELISLRKSSDALIHGGLQWIEIGKDHLFFIRESNHERLAVLLARAPQSLTLELESLEISQLEQVMGDPLSINGTSFSADWSVPGYAVIRIV